LYKSDKLLGRDQTFKESEFLNKSKSTVTPLSTASSSGNSEESIPRTLHFEAVTLRNSTYFIGEENKIEESEDSRKCPDTHPVQKNKVPRERSLSPIWDIEMGQDLPEDDISVIQHNPSKSPRVQNDYRIYLRPRSGSLSEEPSLRPSQSASQVASVSPRLPNLIPGKTPFYDQRLCQQQKDAFNRLSLRRSPPLTILENVANQIVTHDVWNPDSPSQQMEVLERTLNHPISSASNFEQDRELDAHLLDLSLSFSRRTLQPALLYEDAPGDMGQTDTLFQENDLLRCDSDELNEDPVSEGINTQETDDLSYDSEHVLYPEECLPRNATVSGEEELEINMLTQDTFSEASFQSEYPLQPLYMEGRALLAGFGPAEQRVIESRKFDHLNPIEREVAVSLKDHWRPQRL
jgi:hypothetical protein